MVSVSMASGFKWFENRSLWDPIDWQVNQFEIQVMWDSMIWDSMGLKFKKWSLEAQKRSFSRRPPSATQNDPCKVALPWHEICNPSTDSASEASNIDFTKPEILAPATWKASFWTLFKSTTPANVFATLTNSCACHVSCNASISWLSWRLPREKPFEPPKTSRAPGVLTVLTSESFSRHNVVQILRGSTSKSAPTMPVLNDFAFRIALAPQRGANFADIFGSGSSAPPRFSELTLRAFEAARLWKNTAVRAIPTRQNLSCRASVL